MTRCNQTISSVTVSGFLAISAMAAMSLVPGLAHAQGIATQWPSQNFPGGRNSNYPPYNVVPGSSQQSQRQPIWNQTNRQFGNNYNPPVYPGSVYPGLPASSITYVQPDGGGGYVIGSYGSQSCVGASNTSAPSVYGGAPGYVVVDEGAVQDILPVNPGAEYTTPSAPSYQSNEYNYTVNNYYAAPSNSPVDGTAAEPAPVPPAATSPTSAPAAAPSQGNTNAVVQGYDIALGDIQQAWATGEFSLIMKYLPAASSTIKIAVSGEAPGTISTDQFRTMTQAAFTKLTTFSIVITAVHRQVHGSVVGYMTHTYLPQGQSNGQRDTLYWAYTLVDIGGNWTISEIDSSTSPLAAGGASAAAPSGQGIVPAVAEVAVPH